MLVDHLRQIRTNYAQGRRQNDRPPSYDDVVKPSEDESQETEVEPPSYIEATSIIEEPPTGDVAVATAIPAENSTVVTVESTRQETSSPVESTC